MRGSIFGTVAQLSPVWRRQFGDIRRAITTSESLKAPAEKGRAKATTTEIPAARKTHRLQRSVMDRNSRCKRRSSSSEFHARNGYWVAEHVFASLPNPHSWGPTMPTQPHFLWHHAVHEEWADEKLVFIFLSYEPTYAREVAVERVEALLKEQGICSYQIYEITAPYDLLVRAWVPARMREHQLRDLIQDDDKNVLVHILVDAVQIVHHWPWEQGRLCRIGEMHAPPEDLLARGIPLRELETLNTLQSVNGHDEGSNRKPVLAKKYREKRILVRPEYRSGIRFLVLVKVTDVTKWRVLQRRLQSLLYKARRVIKDPSLYRFDNEYQFLIFGHVAQSPGKFHAIGERLVSQINDYAETGGARTYSVFFAIPGFLAFRDELPLPELEEEGDPSKIDVDRLLRKPEGQKLEIKGSAFTELHNWIVEGTEPRRSHRPGTDRSNRAVNELMRSIAGLLNADGGQLVIGAVERSKYGKYDRFKALPGVDQDPIYRCCGLNFDYGDSGDWDAFARLLREVIDKRFDPIPSHRWLKLEYAKVGDRELCVIDIEKPDEWFWVRVGGKDGSKKGRAGKPLEQKFFVRLEGSTRELGGRAGEDFRSENPRKGSS